MQFTLSMLSLRLVSFFIVIVLSQAAKKLPDYLQICHRNDPDIDACIMRSIEALRPRLGRGIAPLQLPPYEPLEIPGLHIDRTTENLEINAQLENLKVGGGSKFILHSLKTNITGNSLVAKITLPELKFSTDFDVTGRILVVPLNGKGSLDGVIKNVKADIIANGKLIDRKKKKYLQIADLKTDLNVGDAQLKFKGPKSAPAALNNVATDFIQENRAQVLQIAKPIIQDTVNEFFTAILNRVFLTWSYDALLPE